MLVGMELHALAEARSLAYHRAVAERLAARPALVEKARERAAGWAASDNRAAPLARAWLERLDAPLPELLAFLVSDSEKARQLRQATPFAGMVPARERWRSGGR